MNKKTNTLLFVLGGTVFNILTTILCFILIFVIYSFALAPLLPENSGAWMLPIAFIASIVASFLIYRLAIKLLMKKIDIEKYFDPIFGPRRPKKPF